MMNERYLFRGKRMDNGEWAQGGYVFVTTADDSRHLGDTHLIYPDAPSVRVYPDTLGQCTGLRDKNGALIFEGDVLERAGIGAGKYLAEWQDHSGRYLGVSCKRMNPKNDGTRWIVYLSDTENGHYEVVGNIHDNPELLDK